MKSHQAIEQSKRTVAEAPSPLLPAACSTAHRCTQFKCGNAPLVYMRQGQSHQTENGFFTIYIDGWYCPKCGGGYGGNPPEHSHDFRCENCHQMFDVMKAECGDRIMPNTLTGLKDTNNPWVKCPHCGCTM